MTKLPSVNILWVLLLSVVLASCNSASNDSTAAAHKAAAIESTDQCHLCGMIITSFEGPKGELVLKGDKQPRKFCSTRDAFSFYLQPENTHRKQALFVHDMSLSPWEAPSDEHFMAAEDAFYVYGSKKKAAMGITLASFSKKMDAEMFVHEFGGMMVAFEDISLELLASEMVMNGEMTH